MILDWIIDTAFELLYCLAAIAPFIAMIVDDGSNYFPGG
jgi:hypothetical protein